MQYEISLKVGSEKPGCDPAALSSLGKLARMISGELEPESPEEDAMEDEATEQPIKSSLGAKAKEYQGGIRKHAMDLFDLRKQDLSNEYDDPETIGKRTK
jgi:hypothetical protein